MKVLSQGTFSANCLCDCGREYLILANLALDGSKCPHCLFPEKFKEEREDI